ncbi:unnamed protein product [Pocillopora meandrina]|uniref:Mediator of RNA polymerase II transcription subunit 7 n=1 Tax=Pocillopora meandrina TaxID=46732 RepID=A0AAU9VU46_9CNID|nr:unnamed protein product [Pocillopora meandrina]
MAAEGVCPFPLPPAQYYKVYTDENVEKQLVPDPPTPAEGAYAMFGASFETDESIIRPLELQGITRLYTTQGRFDRIKELKKLNHSIVINFLELLDILIKSPSSPKREEKLEDLNLLFINIHHLINELRPHQARETLRVMMERQKQQRLDTADKLNKHLDRVVAMLQSSLSSLQLSARQQDSSFEKMEVNQSQDRSEENEEFSREDEIIMIGLLLRTAGQRVLLSNPYHGVLGSRLCKLMVGRVCFHSITRNRFICTRCFKELSVTKEITFLPARCLKMFPGLMWGVSRRFAVTRVGSKGHSASSMRNKTTAIYIIALAVTVVGASYLAVPLYRLYCQATGLGGTVKREESGEKIEQMERKPERDLVIRFNADRSASMQWNFRPQQTAIRLVPGETALAFYTATNPTNEPITGISTYNVIPFEAGQYFNKIQCFCFEEQRLNPHEQVDMPVFFYIDPEFTEDPAMAKVDTITLSYTFFEAKEAERLGL